MYRWMDQSDVIYAGDLASLLRQRREERVIDPDALRDHHKAQEPRSRRSLEHDILDRREVVTDRLFLGHNYIGP